MRNWVDLASSATSGSGYGPVAERAKQPEHSPDSSSMCTNVISIESTFQAFVVDQASFLLGRP
jgi:hypothetical protein